MKIYPEVGTSSQVRDSRHCWAVMACIWTAIVLSLLPVLVMAEDESLLNYPDTDIRSVIKSVANFTNKTIIVDPRVKGNVTVISKPTLDLSKAEVYQIFLAILEVHGFTAVPDGNAIKIVPDADAKSHALRTPESAKNALRDESITQVIQIDHVNAAQLVPILRPLVPPQGHMAAFPQSNVLIISDRANNIERLVNIIKRIDQPSSGEIEIVMLQHAVAADLVRVLTSLQQQSATKGAQPAEKPLMVADERTNSILIGGERADRLQLRAIISHLDTPSEVLGDTHVVYLRYAKAKDLVPVLTGVGDTQKQEAGKGAAAAAKQELAFDIQADESTNALVITAAPTVYKSLESVIRQLDVRRAQVLVEAIIAEVSSDRAAELGVQWLFDGSGSDNPIGAINFGSGTSSISGAAAAAISSGGGTAGALSALGSGVTLGLGQFNSSTFNFAGLIRALQGDGTTNVLSTPNLVTLDNEEAEIFVGQELSIPTGSFASTGSNSSVNPFTTFERKQVGIRLKVKPQINEGDAIRLDIEQKVEGITAGSAGAGDIITSERSIKTSVLVDDGKALVLGGLIKDDLVETQQKVPLLGDIPMLGALFRHKSVQKVKTNLMVFLRPTILRSYQDSLNLTRSKYSFIRDKQLQLNEKGVSLLSDENQPILPPPEEFLDLPAPFDASSTSPVKAPPPVGIMPIPAN